ncbi:MAG: hypothetical protein U0T36_10295 [Saprospiraceae bacterium]|jgi:hypothetical protein
MKIKFYYLLLFLLAKAFQPLFSQDAKKLILSIEYSPNLSQLTSGFITETPKISHHVVLRAGLMTHRNIIPSIGFGYFNTGFVESGFTNISGPIQSLKFVHNYNYLYIPIGAKIKFNDLYFLPELGLAFNLSNRVTQVVEFSNGITDRKTRNEVLNFGEFNKLSIPISLSVGKDFKFLNQAMSAGIKTYYDINKVVKGVTSNNHYYGIGLVLTANF